MKGTLRNAIFTVLLLQAAVVFGQVKTARLQVPEAKGYAFFVSSTVGEFKRPEPVPVTKTDSEVALPDDLNGKRLYVVQTSSGLTAGRDLIEVAKKGSWKPEQKEFTQLLRVVVTTRAKAGVLPVGSVTLTGGLYSDTQLITESSGGKAEFWLVPVDLDSAKLVYEADGNPRQVEEQGPTVEKGEITLDVPEEFAAAPGPSAGQPSGSQAPAQDTEKGEGGGLDVVATIVRMLLGVGIVGGLAYAGWLYYKNNQKAVETVMAKAGIDPKSQADPTGAMPIELEKKPLEKIDLGPQAAELGGSVAPTPSSTGAALGAVANPRLVTAAGEVFMIAEGQSTCGREGAALTIPESSVSRNHAVLARSGGSVTVSDSGSTNGTFVNGARLNAPIELRPGDTVQFGSVQYRYEE